MSFDVTKFRDIGEFARACLFNVTLDNDEVLSFLAREAVIDQSSVRMTIIERDDFYVINKLKELAAKRDQYPVEVKLFSKDGKRTYSMKGDVYGTTFETKLDWSSATELIEWKVDLGVVWK